MSYELTALVQVVIAIVFGGVIGAEREYVKKAAGLRTHMLVAGGSALLVKLGPLAVASFTGSTASDQITSDPTRIIQAIITGISFLGAGTIVFHRKRALVEGLTTAASIFFVAAIGITVAMGAYLLAGGVTVVALVILVGIGYLEERLRAMRHRRDAGPASEA